MLFIKQLGGSSLSLSGTLVGGRAAGGRRVALLAILASARGRPVARDKIVALLWPESSTDRARHQLSDTLYILRSALGDDVIQSSGDDVTLNDALVTSDVADFERLLDAGRLEAAAELFDGPFMDGFHLSDAAPFERWLDSERARLEQRYAGALHDLAQRSEEAGNYPAALAWWRKLAAQEPYSGRVALGLMRCLDSAGDRAGALKHARAHAELLHQEFDAEPDRDVAAFAEQLRLTPVPAPVRRAPQPDTLPDEPARLAGDIAGAQHAPVRRVRIYWAYAAGLLVTVLLAGAVYGVSTLRSQRAETAHSLAVLPFVNMSEASGAYFSDGLTEQIISVLARIPGLRVAARTSSFALRDSKLDIRTIADTLDVNVVLEGSVRREGNQLRVTAQLIDAATGYHIWSGDYDREMRQVVEVQDEIAADIAHALKLRMPSAAQPRGNSRPPNLEAYDLYLRALYLRDTFSPQALSQARQYLDRAIELDPSFAAAYAHKATVLGPAIYFGYVPLEPSVSEARTAIDRALELDPRLGEAYGALGMVKFFFDFDFPGAERALQRAIELNPNDNHAWHQLGNYYRAVGRPLDAVRARTNAVTVDPLNVRIGLMLATDMVHAGRFEEALAQYRRIMNVDAAHPLALGLGPHPPAGPWLIYWRQRRYEDVVGEFARIASVRGATAREVETLRSAYQRAGMPAFWRSWLEFELRHAGSNPDPVRVATFHALAGDNAQALESLERAHRQRNPALVYVPADTMFAALRGDARFRRIFQRWQVLPPDATGRSSRGSSSDSFGGPSSARTGS